MRVRARVALGANSHYVGCNGGAWLRAANPAFLSSSIQQDRFLATQPPVDDTNTPPPPGDSDIAPVSIVEEMKTSYLDYAMSVIVSRATFATA